jgi:hypothetical protein
MNHALVRLADFTLILLRIDKKQNKDLYNVVADLILYLITVGI